MLLNCATSSVQLPDVVSKAALPSASYLTEGLWIAWNRLEVHVLEASSPSFVLRVGEKVFLTSYTLWLKLEPHLWCRLSHAALSRTGPCLLTLESDSPSSTQFNNKIVSLAFLIIEINSSFTLPLRPLVSFSLLSWCLLFWFSWVCIQHC